MTAKEFWEAFQAKVEENRDYLRGLRDAKDSNGEESENKKDSFTERIMKVIKAAICEIETDAREYKRGSHKLGEYVLHREYFKIDLVGWRQKKDTDYYFENENNSNRGYKLKKFAWDLDFALEHENNPNDWTDEVIKLAHIYCNLRVVIGYFSFENDKNANHSMQMKCLSEVSSTLSALDCAENIKPYSFLLILGDKKIRHRKDLESLKYVAYVYEDKKRGFQPI
jgi:hypothetical protein